MKMITHYREIIDLYFLNIKQKPYFRQLYFKKIDHGDFKFNTKKNSDFNLDNRNGIVCICFIRFDRH